MHNFKLRSIFLNLQYGKTQTPEANILGYRDESA
jgi:hypothetical protein